jgi:hypothetical protein
MRCHHRWLNFLPRIEDRTAAVVLKSKKPLCPGLASLGLKQPENQTIDMAGWRGQSRELSWFES